MKIHVYQTGNIKIIIETTYEHTMLSKGMQSKFYELILLIVFIVGVVIQLLYIYYIYFIIIQPEHNTNIYYRTGGMNKLSILMLLVTRNLIMGEHINIKQENNRRTPVMLDQNYKHYQLFKVYFLALSNGKNY